VLIVLFEYAYADTLDTIICEVIFCDAFDISVPEFRGLENTTEKLHSNHTGLEILSMKRKLCQLKYDLDLKKYK
jgi:hypothetical protein